MNQRAIIAAVSLFVLIVAGMFGFAYYQKNQLAQVPTPELPVEEDRFMIDRVDAKHYFIDGEHTLLGEIAMPTPCDLLTARAVVDPNASTTLNLALDVVNNSVGECAMMVTPQRFKESFEGPENMTFTATFRGETVPLNIIEAAEGETPDDFELFIKG